MVWLGDADLLCPYAEESAVVVWAQAKLVRTCLDKVVEKSTDEPR